jgi:hypothetical protein
MLYEKKFVGREGACYSYYKFNFEIYLNLWWTNNKKVERIRNMNNPMRSTIVVNQSEIFDYKWGPRWKHSQLEQKRWMQSPYFAFFTM